MNIIQLNPNPSGARPPIQTWPAAKPPAGYAEIAPGVETTAMQTHAGFVDLSVEDGIVTSITGNDEAYAAWLAEQPEPTQTPPEPTEIEQAQQAITDLQISDIERGQEMTDLQIQMMEGT